MVSNAIDIDYVEYLRIIETKLRLANNKVRFFFIDTLKDFKGVKYLIEILKKYN